ncbi:MULTISPECIES: hypothetical protein [unclassified Achromobacter]|uniref:hypothetical protein n=1 Tax=unclassified Achromobacter TaxID=2626865 RepID=UPI0011785F97|nr:MULTISPECIES: hypothetical protein [unclassified Achromobacter]
MQSTTIFAPRRPGKTQFLMRDLKPAAEKAGFTVACADLWQTQSPALALLQALEEAAEPKGAMGRVLALLKPVKNVKASAKAAGVGGEIQLELGRPYSQASRAILGKQLGVPGLKATSVQKALGALSRLMVLTRTPNETWEFENENFRDWVKTLQD